MNRENIGKNEKYSGAVVLSIGIISQQGANFLPKRIPSRIALFQITIHSWIMYNYYSASIVSARLSEPLDMMEDSVTVLADSNLKIAAEAVPYLNYFLYKLNWESDYFRKKRWDPLPESKRYLPIEEGIRQVSQGILAYHTDPNTAYPYVERMFDSNKICELTEIHLFKQSVMGMYASHNGQFIEIAKIGLTKMFNTGLRDRQIKHWSSRKPQCQPDTLSTRSITIYETAPALILLAFGMVAAGTMCIVENINDYQIIKRFNGAMIPVSIKQLSPNINISRFLNTSCWNLGVFLDLQCSFADEVVTKLFNEASTYYMFDHLHQWLILGEDMNRTVQLLNDSTFSIITDVAITVAKDDNYALYDVYNHCKHCGSLLNITKLGTWTRNDGLKISLSTEKFSRRWNYHKAKVKVAGYVAFRPKDQNLEDYLKDYSTMHTDNFSKYLYSIVIHLQDVFNLSFEILEINYWDKNDTNGPVVTGLRERKFDLAYYPLVLTQDRLTYADVMIQVMPLRTCFMFRTVPSQKMDVNVIFRPFARTVWYMISLLIVIIILALWIIFKAGKDNIDTDSVLVTVAAVCQQGAIVSARLNAPLNKMNDSLYSLVKSKMKLGASKEIYLNLIMNSTLDEIQYFKRYWQSIPEEKKYYSIKDGVKAIMKPGFAYHTEPLKAYPLIERTFDNQMICQLTEVHLLRPSILGVWSTRHGQFQEVAKIGLIRILTSGIRKRELIRWKPRTPFCDEDQQYVSSVTIIEALPIILVLLFGIVLSVIICFMEQMIFRVL
ncbi:hypothetical protein WH47_05469 [Habropoda laboriosa]|uniref:Ionotropic receptor 75a N-terminal domain-containing protein n=1 Tax=Habropoda laboriosa TaxID=597456 RepID=A0A0L7RFL7_9HYME|nr:hypothetical protein WH47_05469 [Habropoda laboriosa]